MKFYRRYYDEDHQEEITEEIAKERLSGIYKDINMAIDAMKRGDILKTASAYYWCD